VTKPLVRPSGPSNTGGNPYRRGYRAPSGIRPTIKVAHGTRLWLTVAAALFDHVTIPLAVLGAALAWHWSAPLGVPLAVVAVGFVARQFRALECMVHEASHFNWSRRHRRLNDLLAGVLAGLPTGIRIAAYRRSHLVHHGRLGTDEDPDRQRYLELDLEGLDHSGAWAYTRGLVTRLVSYQRSWLRATAADPVSLAMPVAWAAGTICVPAVLWLGWPAAAVGAAVWFVGYTVALPVVRFIGESSEHSFSDADTVFDATITNLGRLQRWVIHPHSDGYHTVHHLWPGTPHHHLRWLHRTLMSEDPDGYGTRLRVRRRVLSAPTGNRFTSVAPDVRAGTGPTR
jgi:fatty acid desaturase